MAEYIDRSAAIEYLEANKRVYERRGYLLAADHEAIIEFLNDRPSVDVAPVVHAHWIFGEFDGVGCEVKCSNCGSHDLTDDRKLWLTYEKHQYCGRCGAKMYDN